MTAAGRSRPPIKKPKPTASARPATAFRKRFERTVPFRFLTQTITITWYQLHGNPDSDLTERRRTAPWYPQKTTVSYADMLASLRRELIRHEYWAQAPAVTIDPQITPAQSPSALTAA